MVLSLNQILFVLVLGLPLVGALLALLLRRFLPARALTLIAALPLFIAMVTAILLVQQFTPAEDLAQILPPTEAPAETLLHAPTARWIQPSRTLSISTTLAPPATPTSTPTPEIVPTATIDPRSQVTIAVWNGTGASGVATRAGELLEERGFRVVETENDPQAGERPHSLLLDQGDHPEVRRTLADLFHIEPEYIEIHAEEGAEADITVILGDDYEE